MTEVINLKNNILETHFYINTDFPLDYNLTFLYLVLFLDSGTIDIFEFNEALINLRKQYNLPYLCPFLNYKGDSNE